MGVIQRRISFVKGLNTELADRISRTNDLVTDLSAVDGSSSFDDKYIGANIAKTAIDSKVNTSDIIDDLTSGGSTVPLSAEQGKVLKGLIDGMSNGLAYKGTFDASGDSLPSDPSQGDFYKISVAGTIDGLEMAVGDMIIANKDVEGNSSASDWDKIDNTEAADILRTGDISTDTDLGNEGTKLADRATIKTYVDDAVSSVNIKAANETKTISGDNFTLDNVPLNQVITLGYAQVDNGDGTVDLVTCSCDSDGKVTLDSTDYDGKDATVHYLYV